jgi:NodT family efflux transporter outer membrane factor (OMF) lipoprotein
MTRSRLTALRALAVCALLGGAQACMVGPKYAPPAPPTPEGGEFASPTADIASNDQPPPNWWRLYNAPAIDQLVQTALTHNNTLLEAAANLAQARAALSLARAGLYPGTTLSAGAQYGVTSSQLLLNSVKHGGPAGPAPNPSWTYSAGLDVSYEVDLFGRVRRGIQAAAADYQAQQAAGDASRISVAGETTRAYLNACAYAEELAVARQSLSVVTQTYEVTVQQAGAGGASDFDVARAKEAVNQVQASLPTYDGERRTALFQLAVLTGSPPEQISKDADACTAPPKLNTPLPVGDANTLFRRRPDVRQAERQLSANVARIGVATADLYPTITIGASASSYAGTPAGLGSLSNLAYGIGPLLSWSFPNTLVAQAQVREARAVASASYANFQAAVLQALQDTETALTSYGDELQRNTALAAALEQSRIAFQRAQTRYQLGQISYLDLLTAQTDLVNTSAAVADSDQLVASDQVTVFKALGGGWEQAPPVQPPPIVDGRTHKAEPVR